MLAELIRNRHYHLPRRIHNHLEPLTSNAHQHRTGSWIKDNGRIFVPTETVSATVDARHWQGWGTGLKPAFEPIIIARKPLDD